MATEITGQYISQLDPATIDGSEEVAVEKNGKTVKVTTNKMKEFAQKDVVKDPHYVHTDNNFTQAEKEKLAGITPGGGAGSDGKSAYEIAVEKGFQGTEEEWLASLKGPQGDPGHPGADGQPGAPGANGATLEGQVLVSDTIPDGTEQDEAVPKVKAVKGSLSKLEGNTKKKFEALFGTSTNADAFKHKEFYRISSAAYVSDSNYGTTDKIAYKKGQTIWAKNFIDTQYVNGIVCFNGEEIIGFIKPATSSVFIHSDLFFPEDVPEGTNAVRITTNKEHELTAGYVITSFAEIIDRLITREEISGIAHNLADNKESIIVGSYPHPNEFSVENFYVKTVDGELKDKFDYQCTDFLEVPVNSNIHVTNCVTSAYIASLACFDTAKKFISNVIPPNESVTGINYNHIFRYSDLPLGTKFVRLSVQDEKLAEANVLITSSQMIEDHLKSIDFTLGNISLKGKKIVCIGDSITYMGKPVVGYWGYTQWLAHLAGAEVFQVGIGGARIAARNEITTPLNPSNIRTPLDLVNLVTALTTGDWSHADESVAKLTEYQQLIEDMKVYDWNNADIITIFAGTNDWGGDIAIGEMSSNSKFESCGALNKIISMLSTFCPNARIFYFSPIVRYWNFETLAVDCPRISENFGDNSQNAKGVTLEVTANKLVECAQHNKIPSCDLYHTLGWREENFNSFFDSTDNTHPVKGGQQLGNKMHRFISSN